MTNKNSDDIGLDAEALFTTKTSTQIFEYTNVVDWVNLWLLPTIETEYSQKTKWCASWMQHPEALARLGALWNAWETAQISTDPTERSHWWIYHYPPHWQTLTNPNGPFKNCTNQNHKPINNQNRLQAGEPPKND